MSKYGAVRTGAHASKKEARRSQELHLLEKCGAIFDLKEQVKFEIIPKCGSERAAHYVADFQYLENGSLVVEDVKSIATKTPAYILKRKLMNARHGIVIRET
jgi:hypothetical protein